MIIKELYLIYETFRFFLIQSTFLIIPNSLVFAVPAFLIFFPLINKNFKAAIENLKNKIPISGLAGWWILTGLIGSIFRDTGEYERFEFVAGYVSPLLIGYLIYGSYIIYRNKKYRILAIIFFIINLYFLIFMYYLSITTILGRW